MKNRQNYQPTGGAAARPAGRPLPWSQPRTITIRPWKPWTPS